MKRKRLEGAGRASATATMAHLHSDLSRLTFSYTWQVRSHRLFVLRPEITHGKNSAEAIVTVFRAVETLTMES